MAIFVALLLCLEFANLFLCMLRFFGGSGGPGGSNSQSAAVRNGLPARREVARIFLWLVPEKTSPPDVELADGEQ
jgi:hypothetical protein